MLLTKKTPSAVTEARARKCAGQESTVEEVLSGIRAAALWTKGSTAEEKTRSTDIRKRRAARR